MSGEFVQIANSREATLLRLDFWLHGYAYVDIAGKRIDPREIALRKIRVEETALEADLARGLDEVAFALASLDALLTPGTPTAQVEDVPATRSAE